MSMCMCLCVCVCIAVFKPICTTLLPVPPPFFFTEPHHAHQYTHARVFVLQSLYAELRFSEQPRRESEWAERDKVVHYEPVVYTTLEFAKGSANDKDKDKDKGKDKGKGTASASEGSSKKDSKKDSKRSKKEPDDSSGGSVTAAEKRVDAQAYETVPDFDDDNEGSVATSTASTASGKKKKGGCTIS